MRLVIKTTKQVPGGPRPGRYLTTEGIVIVCGAAVVLTGIVAGVVLR